jgi:membrane-bound metal-dependent hydrolase YbcI (DUF457 family)
MLGAQHVRGGCLFAGIFIGLKYKLTDVFDPSLLLVAGSVIGSLVPDIDSRFSTIKSFLIFKPIGIIYSIIDKLLGKNIITKHRGVLMHSMWTIIILSILTICLTGIMHTIMLGITIGVFSHHVLDFMTPHRLPLYFYPFMYNRVK